MPNTTKGTFGSLIIPGIFCTQLVNAQTTSIYQAFLTSPQESPANASPGTAGVATTTPYFTGFPIGVTSGSYSNTLDLTLASSYNPSYVTANGGTTAGAETALLAAIAADEAYLNIHTSAFPGGEIRGFLTQVPEPDTYALVSAGMALLYMIKRRRAQQYCVQLAGGQKSRVTVKNGKLP